MDDQIGREKHGFLAQGRQECIVGHDDEARLMRELDRLAQIDDAQ